MFIDAFIWQTEIYKAASFYILFLWARTSCNVVDFYKYFGKTCWRFPPSVTTGKITYAHSTRFKFVDLIWTLRTFVMLRTLDAEVITLSIACFNTKQLRTTPTHFTYRSCSSCHIFIMQLRCVFLRSDSLVTAIKPRKYSQPTVLNYIYKTTPKRI
jgi:hypothetical protein